MVLIEGRCQPAPEYQLTFFFFLYLIENKLLGEMGVNAMVQTITRAINHLEKGAKIRSGDGGQTYTFYPI